MIVTGASSGIGAATARLAHSQGARVVLAARRAERLARLADELPGSLAVPTDLTRGAEVEELCDRTFQAFGSIDVLVNNAGQGLHVPLVEVESEDFLAVWELNVTVPPDADASGPARHEPPGRPCDRERELDDIPDGHPRTGRVCGRQVGLEHALPGGAQRVRPDWGYGLAGLPGG